MTTYVGVVRTAKGLRTALDALKDIERDSKSDTILANMTLTARFIAAAALKRKESRGGHYRSDFPDADPALAQRTFMTLADLDAIERPRRPSAADATLAGCRT